MVPLLEALQASPANEAAARALAANAYTFAAAHFGEAGQYRHWQRVIDRYARLYRGPADAKAAAGAKAWAERVGQAASAHGAVVEAQCWADGGQACWCGRGGGSLCGCGAVAVAAAGGRRSAGSRCMRCGAVRERRRPWRESSRLTWLYCLPALAVLPRAGMSAGTPPRRWWRRSRRRRRLAAAAATAAAVQQATGAAAAAAVAAPMAAARAPAIEVPPPQPPLRDSRAFVLAPAPARTAHCCTSNKQVACGQKKGVKKDVRRQGCVGAGKGAARKEVGAKNAACAHPAGAGPGRRG